MMKRIILGLPLILGGISASADPLYDFGDSGIMGNFVHNRGHNGLTGFSTAVPDVQAISQSFTAFEDVSFNQVSQRLGLGTDAAAAGEILTVQIVEDNGGQPTGAVLGTTTLENVGSINLYTAQFSSQVNLTAGKTYHIVTKGDNSGDSYNTPTNQGGGFLSLYGMPNSDYRPYDGAYDASARHMTNAGSGWNAGTYDPYFILADSTSPAPTGLQGPSWDVYQTIANTFTQDTAYGQTFRISNNVAPEGSQITTDNVSLYITHYNSAKDVIVEIRRVDDLQNDVTTVLGTGTLASKAEFDTPGNGAGWYEAQLDTTVTLDEGELYLITTAFKDYESGDANVVFLTNFGQVDPSGNTLGGFGGTDQNRVASTTGQNWSGFSPILDRDMVFSFNGTVIPEPATFVLLGLGCVLMAVRWRSEDSAARH